MNLNLNKIILAVMLFVSTAIKAAPPTSPLFTTNVVVTNPPSNYTSLAGSINVSGTINKIINEPMGVQPAGSTYGGSTTFNNGSPHYVQLTPPTNSVSGFVALSSLNHPNPTAFTATFGIYIGNGSGADGISFNYGKVNTNNGYTEAGMIDSGLAIGFSEYSNTIRVYYNKIQVGSNVTPPNNLKTNDWRSVSVSIDANGQLTVVYSGTTVISNFSLGSIYTSANKNNWQYGFAARCGGLNDLHAINDVVVTDNTPLQYSIDGVNFSTNNNFQNLLPGDYTVYARIGDSAHNAFLNTTTNLGVYQIVQTKIIGTLSATNPVNSSGLGSIGVSITGGSTPFQIINESMGLQPAGSTYGGSTSFNNGSPHYTQLTPPSNSTTGFITFGQPVYQHPESFTANFGIYIGNGSGADGISFNYGKVNTSNAYGEFGMIDSGLAIGFRDYNNTINIFYNKTQIGASYTPPNNLKTNDWRSVSISVNNGSLTVVYSGTTVISNYILPAAFASANKNSWQFGFAARCGGLNNLHAINDVVITDNTALEYSKDGVNYQTSNTFDNLPLGSNYSIYARIGGANYNSINNTTVNLGNAKVCAPSSSSTNTTICSSALPYSWNGLSITGAGTHTAHFTNSYGCDSTAALNLTVVNSPVIDSISPNSLCHFTAISIVADNTAKKVQWQLNGTIVSTDSSLIGGVTSGVTVAGGNGAGSAANQFHATNGVFVDAAGNVYIADGQNNRIQKWAPGATSGTTVAGGNGLGSSSNKLDFPTGVSVDAAGNVYIADFQNNRIQKWAPGATSGTTVAGGNGYGSAANQTNNPRGLFVDAAGNIYIVDAQYNRIQKWAPGATSGTTVAGGNGQGNAANQLAFPLGVFVDAASNVYIADAGNNRIQKWAPGAASGTTVAGGNGGGSGANQFYPHGIFVDAAGNIYIADEGNSRIQKWAPGATSGTTVAGGFGHGSAANQVGSPTGVFVDAAGNIYIADNDADRIQKWGPGKKSASYTPTQAGTYTAVVSNTSGCASTSAPIIVHASSSTTNVSICPSQLPYSWNGSRAAAGIYTYTTTNSQGCDSVATLNLTVNKAPNAFHYNTPVDFTQNVSITPRSPSNVFLIARRYDPYGVAVDIAGNVFVSDYDNDEIKKIDINGNESTFYSTGIRKVRGLATDIAGNVYVTNQYYNTILKISPSGTLLNTYTGFNNPRAVAVDNAGNIYVADEGSNQIKKINTSGTITAIGSGFVAPEAVAVDATGNIYVGDFSGSGFTGKIKKMTTNGTISVIATGSNDIRSIAVDADNNIYVANGYSSGGQIQVILPSGFQLFFGSGFSVPTGVAVDAAGNVYVADDGNYEVYKIARGGSAANSYSISPSLPAGLSLNTNTGVISGTPTAASVATNYTITAHNLCTTNTQINIIVHAACTPTASHDTIHIFSSALPYSWNGLTFNAAGTQTAHLTNAAGCDSAATLTLNVTAASAQLNLKLYLQGLYLGNGAMIASPNSADGVSPTNIADTITVELRDTTSSHTLVTSKKSTISTSGIVSSSFSGTLIGNAYFVVIKHRNSIATWSANPIVLSQTNNYDFSNAANKAFGSNLANDGSGIFMIFSGDINQDGSVDFNDYPDLDISSSNGDLGYYVTDLNGDASVDFNDYPLLDTNSNLGALVVTP